MPEVSHMWVASVLLVFALAATGLSAETWVERLGAAAEAVAGGDLNSAAAGYAEALELAPFDEADPRYPILLFNRSFACSLSYGAESACRSLDENREQLDADHERAILLMKKHGELLHWSLSESLGKQLSTLGSSFLAAAFQGRLVPQRESPEEALKDAPEHSLYYPAVRHRLEELSITAGR